MKIVARILPAFIVLAFAACGTSPAPPVASKQDEAPGQGPVLRFSQRPPITGGHVKTNWCLGSFGESLVINAEKDNYNRRYFYLGEGVTKINVSGDGQASGFFLRRSDTSVVEVFHGAQFPDCLSMPSNFIPNENGRAFQYKNPRNLHYSVDIRDDNGQPVITIELPPETYYGMSVNRCINCE